MLDCCCFLAFDLCRFCMIICFFIPTTTANDLRLRRIFYPRFYPLHKFSYLNGWQKSQYFPFEWSVLNKGTTGTIFITSLVWCCPWLGIEPGTSCTRCQHSTTRLSRRRLVDCWLAHCLLGKSFFLLFPTTFNFYWDHLSVKTFSLAQTMVIMQCFTV